MDDFDQLADLWMVTEIARDLASTCRGCWFKDLLGGHGLHDNIIFYGRIVVIRADLHLVERSLVRLRVIHRRAYCAANN